MMILREKLLKFTIMKKVIKKKVFKEISWISGKEITYTISEEPSKGIEDPYVAKKLEEMNKLLRTLKTPLPK